MIIKIIRKLNVTSLLILPIYNHIFDKKITNVQAKLPLLFQVLCIKYGLINSFILNRNEEFDGTIKLLFNKNKVREEDKLSKDPYFSLNERLIDSKLLKSVRIIKDYLLYELIIPEEYLEDVNLIIKGDYSKVSPKYKELLNINSKYIASSGDDITNYILSSKLSLKICSTPHLVIREIATELNAIVPEEVESLEAYNTFSPEKEKLYIP